MRGVMHYVINTYISVGIILTQVRELVQQSSNGIR